ncbi:glycosyltransferase family 9 protein [Collimonas silvisoli]|uniref:glycosyltransferase family 9 protein n=1 Tax=Collimonas silvisoli TaxID=2825884 RepID=UPI001B8C0017|nr:glycosyltransferase family 9 protein [Collimonas silvisoli]
MTNLNELIAAYAAYQTDGNVGTALHLIRQLRGAGKVEDAIALANQWAAKTATPMERAQLGVDMSYLGMFAQAEVLLEEAAPQLASNPDASYQVELELSIVKYCQGKFHQAHLLQKSLHAPEWCEVWTRLASPNQDNSWFLPYLDKVLHKQPVAGKSILISSEGGAGDLLQLCRYVEKLRQEGAAAIYCSAPRSLHGLLRNAGLGIVVAENPDDMMRDCDLITWPFALFTRYQQSPYFPRAADSYLTLARDYVLPESIQEKLRVEAGGRQRIGLTWRSNSGVRHEPFRSIELTTLLPLLENSSAEFFSLQVGELSEPERMLMAHHRIVDLGAHLRSFEDTAHVMERLDLVISIDSAPAHLAGARNRPVWVLLAQASDYRWYDSQRYTPWYSSMRLYRQTRLGDWQPVIAEMAEALTRQG